MIPRLSANTVAERLEDSPAAAIVGPRQCGKTTLARSIGPRYFDLEQESDRLRLDLEWADIAATRELVVLDEAQSWPEVFPRLRGAIDADRSRNGRFLLLGSVSPALMTHVSESLAGRLALVELTPLLLTELRTKAAANRLWLTGGFPDGGVLRPRSFPNWQADYLRLLVQRDLPNWGLPARPQVTERLLRMLAAVHGQSWNASQIGKSLGLSYHTVNSYLDYLEGAFLIRRLPAYHANLKKRIVKSPKVYWRDSGLLHSVLNVSDHTALLSQPWVGASWEGFVIDQVLGHLAAWGISHDAYHLRTSDRYEIDLVLEMLGEVWAIEVKLTTSPSPADMRRLDHVADLIGATRRVVVSKTAKPAGDRQRSSTNLASFLADLGERVAASRDR
jgi:predicted AAA+ superfamily ATPase